MEQLDLRLYAIVDPENTGGHDLVDLARAVAAGGATVVQLRDKVNDPVLQDHTDMNYRGWDLEYSDVERAKEFAREWKEFDAKGDAPQFMVVRMGNDHTQGTRAGALTPFAYVAQNDQGVGMLVDAVSHSKLWESTAIFIIEDDAQNGIEVNRHRLDTGFEQGGEPCQTQLACGRNRRPIADRRSGDAQRSGVAVGRAEAGADAGLVGDVDAWQVTRNLAKPGIYLRNSFHRTNPIGDKQIHVRLLAQADEPTRNLDSKNAEAVFEIFSELARHRGRTIVMVTHDVDFARRASRQIRLKDGRLVGDVEE